MSDGIKQAVIESLKQIKGPDLEGNIVSLGLVSDVFVSDGRVAFWQNPDGQRLAI